MPPEDTLPTIALTQGKEAKVDWQDYKDLARYKWQIKGANGSALEARRHATRVP